MKTKRIGWCVAMKGKKGFEADGLTVATNRGDAIWNDWWDKESYRRSKRRGDAKTIPVYVNEADLV